MNSLKKNLTPSLIIGICAFLLVLTLPSISAAQQTFSINDKDMDADIVPRLAAGDAEASITTREGYVDLLLNHDSLIIQFSDKKLDKIAADIKNEEKSDDEEHFVAVLKSMISGGVRTLLDRGLAIPLYEISEVSYNNGRLIILNRTGEEIFKDMEIDDKPLMEQFSRRDARRFIAEIERRMI